MDDEARPWYAAGLYRRIQERRRWRPERTPRKPWRQRLRERGLHWSVEVVVGAFVAVFAASLITVALASGGSFSLSHGQNGGGGAGASGASGTGASGASDAGGSDAGGSGTVAAPTPQCIAAPIAGSPLRPCSY